MPKLMRELAGNNNKKLQQELKKTLSDKKKWMLKSQRNNKLNKLD